MKRKINKVGPGTLTISLPKKWIERNGLGKGDELELEEKANEIMIRSQNQKIIRKVKIHVPLHKKTIIRVLFYAYKSGAEEVELTFDDPECGKIVEESMGRFIGFEVIETGENKVIVKDIADIKEKDFEKTFRRFIDLTIFFVNKVYQNLVDCDFEALKKTLMIERTQDKLQLFCQRSLSIYKESLTNLHTFYYLLTQRIEDVADYYKEICEYYSEKKGGKISGKTLDFMKNVNDLLKDSLDFYYNFKLERNIYLYDTRMRLEEEGRKLFLSQPREEIFALYALQKIVVATYEIASPVFAIRFSEFAFNS